MFVDPTAGRFNMMLGRIPRIVSGGVAGRQKGSNVFVTYPAVNVIRDLTHSSSQTDTVRLKMTSASMAAERSRSVTSYYYNSALDAAAAKVRLIIHYALLCI